MYAQPIGVVYPFDTATTPGFQIVYAIAIMSTTCISNTICFADCLFMGICGQIVACKRDLRDMLAEIDANNREQLTGTEQLIIEGRLNRCVRFHHKIARYRQHSDI